MALFKAAKSELQRKSEGSRLDMGTFGMQTLTTALHTAPREPPDPSGGNAAVVRDKKVIRLSVLPDIRGGLPFYQSPLPTALAERVLSACPTAFFLLITEWVWSVKECNGMEGWRVARRATRRPGM